MRFALLLACLLAACAAPARRSCYHLLTAADADAVVARDGSGDFRTIGEAVARVPPGALILVRPGRFREAVTLHSGVRLAGSCPDVTVIDADGAPAALTLDDSGSVVSGLALPGGRETGISIAAGRHLVERCLIADNGALGIVLAGLPGTAAEFDHCTIAGNPVAALSVAATGPARLAVRNSIVAFNGRAAAGDSPPAPGQLVFEHSCLHNLDPDSDRLLGGKTAILDDPAFVERGRDYHLSSNSPCIGKSLYQDDLGCFP